MDVHLVALALWNHVISWCSLLLLGRSCLCLVVCDLPNSKSSAAIRSEFTTIGIRSMTSKSAVTKFEVEKFNGKSNFLLWKMRVTTLLVKEGVYRALEGKEKKSSTMDEEEFRDIDFRARATIILCLSDEVLYNVMSENTTTAVWCKLESLYMTKS